MKYSITGHLLERMRERGIDHEEIAQALDNIVMTMPTPKQSTCITGRVKDGRLLKIWVVGAYWPQSGTLAIKTSAWKD